MSAQLYIHLYTKIVLEWFVLPCCGVWECSNRKGRYPGSCMCPELHGKDCPELSMMLSLFSISKMPHKIY